MLVMRARLLALGSLIALAACVAPQEDDTHRASSRATTVPDDPDGRAHPAPCFRSFDIPGLGDGFVSPQDLNAKGHVAGAASRNGLVYAIFWDGVTTHQLGSGEGYAMALNDNDEVVGLGMLYRNGEAIALGSLGGDPSATLAGDINNSGQVVGNSQTADGQTHAFLWENGSMRDLGTFDGGTFSSAIRINDRGEILILAKPRGETTNHLVLWQNGTMTDLGTHEVGAAEVNARGDVLVGDYPNASLWRDGTRTAIVPFGDASATMVRAFNDGDQVVGAARRADPERFFAFLWQDGRTTEIGAGQDEVVTPLAINEFAGVVGFLGNGGVSPRAFYWRGGELTYLAPENERTLAEMINDAGRIVGLREGTAAVWDPIACSGETDGGASNDAGGGNGGGTNDAATNENDGGTSGGKTW
jgi:probable HAF family extracellular repeat protein